MRGVIGSVQNWKRGAVQEDVLDSVNRGGSVQLEFIVSAGQELDSSQESELVTTL